MKTKTMTEQQYQSITALLLQMIGSNIKNEAVGATILQLVASQQAAKENKSVEDMSKEINALIVANQTIASKAMAEMVLKLGLIPSDKIDALKDFLKPKPSDN